MKKEEDENLIKNFEFSENIFNKEPQEKKIKNKKKKNKIVDFIDYANENGIEFNLKYEDTKGLQMKQPN